MGTFVWPARSKAQKQKLSPKKGSFCYSTTAVTNSEDLSKKTAEGPNPHEDPSGFYSSLQVRCVVSALAKAIVWCKSDKDNGVLVSLTKMRDKPRLLLPSIDPHHHYDYVSVHCSITIRLHWGSFLQYFCMPPIVATFHML